METIFELTIVIFRIATILPLLLVVTLFMGKRSIGELPIFDFLIIMTLASVTGADIADPNIEHFPTVVAIIFFGLLQKFVTVLILKKRWIGKAITFEPTVVIEDGVLLIKNIEEIKYSIDNILQMLREKDIFDLAMVKIAIVEANGKLTVQKITKHDEVTLDDLDLDRDSTGIAYPVIIEGSVYPSVLKNLGYTVSWLQNKLKEDGVKQMSDIVFASITDKGDLHISLKNATMKGPPFHH